MQYITIMVADNEDLSVFLVPGDDPYSGEPVTITGESAAVVGSVLMIAQGPNPTSPNTIPAHNHPFVGEVTGAVGPSTP